MWRIYLFVFRHALQNVVVTKFNTDVNVDHVFDKFVCRVPCYVE